MRNLLAIFTTALFCLGCGASAELRPDPVPVMLQVTHADGKPVKDVLCVFTPHTARQTPGSVLLSPEGKPATELKLIPGMYTIHFEANTAGKAGEKSRFDAAYKLVPQKYQQPSGHDVQISGGSEEKIVLKS